MSTTSHEYDLAIVGAGPAGTTAAMYAIRHGLRAIVVDRATFPRDKICGDALGGKSMSVLDELGLVEDVERLQGAEINHVILSSPAHIDLRVDMRDKEHYDPLTGRHVPMRGFVIRRDGCCRRHHRYAVEGRSHREHPRPRRSRLRWLQLDRRPQNRAV